MRAWTRKKVMETPTAGANLNTFEQGVGQTAVLRLDPSTLVKRIATQAHGGDGTDLVALCKTS